MSPNSRFHLHILPVVHGKALGSFGSMATLRQQLMQLRPRIVFIEADPRESNAEEISVCQSLPFLTSLVRIDACQRNVRRLLSQRLISQPAEFIRLAQWPADPPVASEAEAAAVRSEFVRKFPTAADLLFDYREEVMTAVVRSTLADWRRATFVEADCNVAIVAGAAHCEALRRQLEQLTCDDKTLSLLQGAWKSSTPSPLPIILIFYGVVPLLLFCPWGYLIARSWNGTAEPGSAECSSAFVAAD